MLEASPAKVVATLDHAGNAKGVGQALRPTQITFFGHPKVGTPLMQKNQLAGLDLPHHVLVYENAQGQVYTVYNSVQYLSARYGLKGVSSLPSMHKALTKINSKAANHPNVMNTLTSVSRDRGVIVMRSPYKVDETYVRVKNLIKGNDQMSIVFELDHAANATSVGMTLRPTRVIAFGNPKMGTKLMQKNQQAGLDLPQKILVWEDEKGVVRLAYNDPFYVASRHGVKGIPRDLEKMSKVLSFIGKGATGAAF